MKTNRIHKCISNVIIFQLVMMAMVFAGCSNKTNKSAETTETEQEEVDPFLKLAKVAVDADCIYDFSEGLAAFKKDGKIGVVNKNGDIVLSPTSYDGRMSVSTKECGRMNPLMFVEGLALVRKGGYYDEDVKLDKQWKYGYLDKNGKEIIPCTFDDAFSFCEGYAVVCKEGKYGIIDKTGKQVVPYKYDRIQSFSDGLALVGSNDKIGFINSKGEEVVPIKFIESLWENGFLEGFAVVRIDDGEYVKHGYIDKSGKIVVEPTYNEARQFHDGRASVGNDGKYGYIDTKGKEIIPLIYDYASDFSDGIAVVRNEGKYQIIDKSGKSITQPIYTSFGWFVVNGTAKLGDYDAETTGLIDKNGKEIIPLNNSYEDFGYCREGFITIKKNNKWGFLDKTGKQVIPCIYDEVYDFSDGYAVVKKDGIYGYLTKEGKCTLDIDDSELKSLITNKKREIDEKKRAKESEQERERMERESVSSKSQANGDINVILNECQTEITAIQREIEGITRTFVALGSQDVDMYKYTQMKSVYMDGVDDLVKKADKAFDNCARKLKDAGITDADAKIKEEKRNFHSAIYELRTRAIQQTDMSY